MGEKHLHTKEKVKKDWPVVVYFATFGIGILSYMIGRIALDGYPHPIHWTSGLIGAIVGCLVGWFWYRWRGDII
jgi:hypothetical protein